MKLIPDPSLRGGQMVAVEEFDLAAPRLQVVESSSPGTLKMEALTLGGQWVPFSAPAPMSEKQRRALALVDALEAGQVYFPPPWQAGIFDNLAMRFPNAERLSIMKPRRPWWRT